MPTYRELRTLLLASDDVEHGVPAAAEEIELASEQLGTLPADYCDFLADFGHVAVRQYEVFGLGAGTPPYLDVLKIANEERTTGGLPNHLVPLMNDGAGNFYCIDVSTPDAELMVRWDHEVTGTVEWVASSFSAWLIDLVRRE